MYRNAYIKIHQEFDHLLSSQLGVTRYLSEHHSYNEAKHKICLYFNEGYILDDNKIKCIVALKQENKYILCRDIVLRLSPLLFREIIICETHIGTAGYPKISNLIDLINSKPIFEFNRITIKDVHFRRLKDCKLEKIDLTTFQFIHSKLNQFNVIEDLGELAFDFESIYAVKGLPHNINPQSTEYTLVGKNFYAPLTNTAYCHCILFAQEFNIHDEYAIEVKKMVSQ